MAEFIVLPKMNLTMEEGTLAKWYKKEGDKITEEEPLCSVENEKETEDMLSIVSGTILKLIGEEGSLYKISTPIAIVGEEGEDFSALLNSLNNAGEEKDAEREKINVSQKIGAGLRMMPKIRKLIKEKGINIEDLVAFAGEKTITEADITAFEKGASVPLSLKATDTTQRMTTMRKSIAKNMMESCAKTARLTNFTQVDVTDLYAKTKELKGQGKKISQTALIIKACAYALKENQIVNTQVDETKQEIIFKGDINIGCAVDIEGGLGVPVIKNADTKDVFAISSEIEEYAKMAALGKLTNEVMQEGTFTVSNVGMLGVTFFTPIINYPQTAILAVGAIETLPRYEDESYTKIVPKKIMTIGITYDHRVIDGAPASRFLQSVVKYLQNAEKLF